MQMVARNAFHFRAVSHIERAFMSAMTLSCSQHDTDALEPTKRACRCEHATFVCVNEQKIAPAARQNRRNKRFSAWRIFYFYLSQFWMEVQMKFAGFRWICRAVIASMLMLQFSFAQSAMVGAEQMLSPATVQADRATVNGTLSRAEVATQLQAMGVDAQAAQDRVAAMTDSEVHALAGNIDAMPAGAMASGWWWAIGAAIIALVVYYNWKPNR
jgi:hypothetical protein